MEQLLPPKAESWLSVQQKGAEPNSLPLPLAPALVASNTQTEAGTGLQHTGDEMQGTRAARISRRNKQGLHPWLYPAVTTHLSEHENSYTVFHA